MLYEGNFNNIVALREDRLGGKSSRHGAKRDLIGRTALEGEASNSWRALSSSRNIGVFEDLLSTSIALTNDSGLRYDTYEDAVNPYGNSISTFQILEG
jgi:hypothetical protein